MEEAHAILNKHQNQPRVLGKKELCMPAHFFQRDLWTKHLGFFYRDQESKTKNAEKNPDPFLADCEFSSPIFNEHHLNFF